ncbi:MAG TPA: glycosyltransferase family 2 protein [bacterium]|nr:glycosyltransferase family 2 protein [bacterium]
MEKITLSIIIVDYNAGNVLLDCLASIKKHPMPFSYEIIVVDNASRENRTKEYESVMSHVRTIRLPHNSGFGAGNNAGVKIAKGDYLLLLNPDTLVVDDTITTMVSFIQKHEEIGALTCLLYQKNQKMLQKDFFANFQSFSSVLLRKNHGQMKNPEKEYFYVQAVTGAALMIKKSLFDQVGGFDERFFMYLEDHDLCQRLVNLGYKNAVLNKGKIIHLEGQSSTSQQKKRFYYASQNYYWHKHNGALATTIMRIMRFPYQMWQFYKSR